jgi:outer membrane protein OmpA-like peptidoglycan-associated protein
MQKQLLSVLVLSALVGGCASTGDGPGRMTAEELSNCLDPNRRAEIEIVGQRPKPAPKPVEGKPAPKPEKPEFLNVEEKHAAQGRSAFDIGSAVLKEEGRKEIDDFIAQMGKQSVRIGAVIVSGHADRNEQSRSAGLSEQRAKAVTDYIVGKGIDQKLVFWEGKGDKVPVPVTKFCE